MYLPVRRPERRPDPDHACLISAGAQHILQCLTAGVAPTTGLQWSGPAGPVTEARDEFLNAVNVAIMSAPETHRDGARSGCCRKPDGTVVQVIFHPPTASPPRE
jgi:hypothetical protein